ncbi:phage holin family protein [Pontibacter beigongshangensis]|uniref:phage holin family protein n=1 Tax=Pontibacter beigongshangensis TaxID=2574733 RepID=UPI00164EF607|nr:phage holin family protein [Pontibacter beigongshangensis]
MDFIVNLLISAGVIVLLAYILPSVHVKSFWTALWVAFLIGLLNATIGWILGGILNLVTFFLLDAIVGLIVTTLMIKLVDKLVRNFKVDGFLPALIIAIATALAIAAVGYIRGSEGENERASLEPRPQQTEQLLAQM